MKSEHDSRSHNNFNVKKNVRNGGKKKTKTDLRNSNQNRQLVETKGDSRSHNKFNKNIYFEVYCNKIEKEKTIIKHIFET